MLMKKLVLILLAAMIIFSPALADIQFNNYSYFVDIRDSEKSSYTVTLNLKNEGEPSNEFFFPMSMKPENVLVYKEQSVVPSEVVERDGTYYILMNESLKENETVTLNIDFQLEEATSKLEDKWIYSMSHELPTVNSFKYKVKLPRGFVISDFRGKKGIFPSGYKIGSDGERIIISWEKEKVGGSTEFFALISFENSESQTPLFVYFIPLILVAAGAFIYFYIQKREEEAVAVGLGRDEKKLYDILREEGKIEQKEIKEKLDMSKPRVSRLIRKLEEKGLIEKVPSGRTNLIKLKKKKEKD